jgi:sec-independent protein translocase protein TatC
MRSLGVNNKARQANAAPWHVGEVMSMDDKVMTMVEHLEELRWRIMIAVGAIVVGAAGAYFLANPILNVLLLPSGGLHLKAFHLLDGFMIKWRIALYMGMIVAFPVWAYEAYKFINPGLLAHERKMLLPALVGSLLLFLLGACFGYSLLWGMMRVLVHLFPQQVEYLPSADDYLSFVTFFLLVCGLAFQLPTVLIMLVHLHLLTSALLRKQRRIAYFALFAFAELMTPVSDPIIAPLTVMAPLSVLYELSIGLTRRIERRRSQAVHHLAPV